MSGGWRDREGLADPYMNLQGLAAEGLGACPCAPAASLGWTREGHAGPHRPCRVQLLRV